MSNTEALLQQAAQQIAQGQHDQGEQVARGVLAEHPNHPQAHYVVGLAYYLRKQYPEAVDTFTKASKLAPGNPMVLSNLGESLRRNSEPEKALEAFERAIKLQPGFTMGQMGKANCLSDLKRNAEALKEFQRVLALDPQFAPGYHYLGAHLSRQDQHKQALPLLRKAVALRENYTDGLMTLASTLEGLDQVDESVEILEKLLQNQPDNIALLLNLGNIIKTQGKLDEANALFERVLKIDPENVAVQYSISHAKKGVDAAEIDSLEARLKDPDVAKDPRRALHFTLGKYYDDSKDYPKAFSHFKRGNDMDDRIEPYNAAGFSRGVDRIIETLSAEFFKKRTGMGSETDVPIFIVGMPRSGTSLTEQILASHSKVYGAGELKNVGDLQRQLQQQSKNKVGFPDNLRGLDPITACNLGERYLREIIDLSDRGGFARITDKMPGNTTNLGLIALMLPRARIIHCKRNPMDSCFSCYSRNFSSVISYTRQQEDLGHHYCDYHRLMEHWKKVLPLQILEVRYEDMVADQENMSRKLIEFCGLEWEDACLDFQNTERRVKTASTIQVRQPIYNSSVSKWRQYETELQPLFDTLGELAPKLENGVDIYP